MAKTEKKFKWSRQNKGAEKRAAKRATARNKADKALEGKRRGVKATAKVRKNRTRYPRLKPGADQPATPKGASAGIPAPVGYTDEPASSSPAPLGVEQAEKAHSIDDPAPPPAVQDPDPNSGT